MLFYCTEDPEGAFSYVYWMEDGKEEKFRVKSPFSMTKRTKLIPKLKPIPDCLALNVRFEYWSEAYTPRAIDQYTEPRDFAGRTLLQFTQRQDTFFVAAPIDPEWEYLPLDPNNSESIIGYINGEAVYSSYKRDIGIRAGSSSWFMERDDRLCASPELHSVFNSQAIYLATVFTLDDSSVGLGNKLYQGETVGGIVSVQDWFGNEYVEKVDEFCDLEIYDTSGKSIFKRRIKDCSTVTVQCDDDCPPGSCKCWISRAAKTFCCAKCQGHK